MVQDGVDIDEVHSVRDVEAFTVGVKAVWGQRARQVFGASTRARVITERIGSAPAGHEIGRRQQDVRIRGAKAGGPVGRIAPEGVRVRDEVNERGGLRRWRMAGVAVAPRGAGQEKRKEHQRRDAPRYGRRIEGVRGRRSLLHVDHRHFCSVACILILLLVAVN